MKRLLITIALLAWVHVANAAITCGDATEFNDLTPATNGETISYTTPAGSNQILLVGFGNRNAPPLAITGVTHAGNAMTAVTTQAEESPVGARMYYIVNPTSGTNNVVVSYTGTPLADAAVITTCAGVNTSDPIRGFQNANGTSTAPSVTVTDQADDMVVDFFFADTQTGNPTEGANQTLLHSGNDGAESGWGSSYQSGGGDGVMSWTIGSNQQWAITAVVLKPAVAATSLGPLKRRAY